MITIITSLQIIMIRHQHVCDNVTDKNQNMYNNMKRKEASLTQ